VFLFFLALLVGRFMLVLLKGRSICVIDTGLKPFCFLYMLDTEWEATKCGGVENVIFNSLKNFFSCQADQGEIV
jgi:hypothetical protein